MHHMGIYQPKYSGKRILNSTIVDSLAIHRATHILPSFKYTRKHLGSTAAMFECDHVHDQQENIFDFLFLAISKKEATCVQFRAAIVY